MNFSQLRFTKAAYELGSFTKAAHACNVTQPTLSNGISKLETELNNKIFNRTTRFVGLTEFGQTLMPKISSILSMQNAIYCDAKSSGQNKRKIIQIGFSPLIDSHVFTKLIASYKMNNKDIEIIFTEDNLNQLELKLANRELDLILVPITEKTSKNNEMLLYSEDLVVVVPSQPQKSHVLVSAIRDKTFIMVPDSCGLSTITRAILQTTSKSVNEYKGKALSYQVLADWALNGLGLAILPKSKTAAHMHTQKLHKSNTQIQIHYKAKWLSKEHSLLSGLLVHFTQNVAIYLEQAYPEKHLRKN